MKNIYYSVTPWAHSPQAENVETEKRFEHHSSLVTSNLCSVGRNVKKFEENNLSLLELCMSETKSLILLCFALSIKYSIIESSFWPALIKLLKEKDGKWADSEESPEGGWEQRNVSIKDEKLIPGVYSSLITPSDLGLYSGFQKESCGSWRRRVKDKDKDGIRWGEERRVAGRSG